MKIKGKSLIALLLVAVMCLGMGQVPVYAAETMGISAETAESTVLQESEEETFVSSETETEAETEVIQTETADPESGESAETDVTETELQETERAETESVSETMEEGLLMELDDVTMEVETFAADSTITFGNGRYTILIFDHSSSMSGTALTTAKAAAIKFCQSMLESAGNNYLAIISYGTSAKLICDFTDDETTLTSALNSITATGQTDTHAALSMAYDLFTDGRIPDSATKNAVLLSDGLPQTGDKSTSGPYTSSDSSSYYAYANASYAMAVKLREICNFYTLGFFHSLSGSNLTFAQRFMEDMQNAGYYNVTNVDDLEFVFGELTDDLINEKLKELYVKEHVAFFNGAVYDQYILEDYDDQLGSIMEDVNGDNEIRLYSMLDTMGDALNVDVSGLSSDYELIIAQLVYNDQAYIGYQDLFASQTILYIGENFKYFVEALKTKGDTDNAKKLNDMLAELNAMDSMSTEWYSKYAEMNTFLNSHFTASDVPEVFKDWKSDLISYGGSTVLSTAGETLQYYCYLEAYQSASKALQGVLLQLYYEVSVDDYIWSDGPFADLENFKVICNADGLMGAIDSFLSAISNASEDTGKLVAQYGVEKGISKLTANTAGYAIEKLIELHPAGKIIKTLLESGKTLIDIGTQLDDREFAANMLVRLHYVLHYMHGVTDSLGHSMSGSGDQFFMATQFDEAINVYKNVVMLACDFAEQYEGYLLEEENTLYTAKKKNPLITISVIEKERHNKQTSWYSTAMTLAVLEKAIYRSIECHSDRLIYDRNTNILTYDEDKLKIFVVACPVDMTVTDASGNPYAFLSNDTVTVKEGYEAYFHTVETGLDDGDYMKIAIVPEDFNITLTGTGDGTMDVYMAIYNNGVIEDAESIQDIPVTDGTEGVFIGGSVDEGPGDLVVDGSTYSNHAVASGTSGDSMNWLLNEQGILSIQGTGAMTAWTSSSDVPWWQYRSQVKKVIVGDGITSISFAAFFDCDNLREVQIGEDVAGIETSVFRECGKLTDIIVDSENQTYCSINGVLFTKDQSEIVQYPEGRTETVYEIPDGVTTIGYGAFYNGVHLTEVVLPDTVSNLESYAFAYCDSLTTLVLPDGVKKLSSHAISSCCGLTGIEIPASVTSIGFGNFHYCTALTEIQVSSSNTAYCDVDGVLFDKSAATLVQYPWGRTDKSYIIPDGVTTISYSAFYTCENLEGITVPASVTAIRSAAFGRCYGLKSLFFRGDAPAMDDRAFYETTATAYYPSGNSTWTADILKNYEGDLTWKTWTPAGTVTNISGCTAALSQSSYVSDGEAKTPSVQVKNGSTTLTANRDYTVSYQNNTVPGKATVTITGQGNYTGSLILSFIIKPGMPAVSALANTASGIDVQWNQIDGADGYLLYRKAGSETSWKRIATITDGTTAKYTDTSVSSGTKYTYTVRAYVKVDGSSQLSTYTNGKMIYRLSQPSVSTANASGGITVKWGKVTGATEYRVYRKAGTATAWSRIATITNTSTLSYTDTKAASGGGKYVYTVRAYKTVGSSAYGSSFMSGSTIYRLSQPAVSTQNVSGGVMVKWSKVTGATGYVIFRKTASATSWTQVKKITNNTTVSWGDASAKTNGQKYTYTVKAYKTVSSKTYTSSHMSGKIIYFLTCPTISSLTNSSSRIMKAVWNKNSTASGYQLQYSLSSSFTSATTKTYSGNSSYSKSIGSLTKGKTYYVRVRSYKTVGSTRYYSRWSAVKAVTIKN